jgi:hypothetical protein
MMTSAQHVGLICPGCWIGVVSPLNAKRDFVMHPLAQIGMLNPVVAASLKDYQQAPPAQQAAWIKDYSAALQAATVDKGQVALPQGRYGPVAPLMQAMLNLARAGLLDGALAQDADPRLAPYNTSYTRDAYMRRLLVKPFACFLSFHDTVCEIGAHDDGTGNACCTLYSFRLGADNQKL